MKVLLHHYLSDCKYIDTYSVRNHYLAIVNQDNLTDNYFLPKPKIEDAGAWVMNTLRGRGAVQVDWHPDQEATLCGGPGLNLLALAMAATGLARPAVNPWPGGKPPVGIERPVGGRPPFGQRPPR